MTIIYVRQAVDRINAAIAQYNPSHVFALFSGGHDSLTATYIASRASKFDGAVHIDTGTGIKATRCFVEDTCERQGWPLKIYEAMKNTNAKGEPDPQDYREIVRQYGFPGPGGHGNMYNRLKERAVRILCRQHKQGFKDKIMLIAGCRNEESKRRMGKTVPVASEGCRIWVNPIHDWSKAQCNSLIDHIQLERNPVVDLIHRSGECNCFSGDQEYITINGLVRFDDSANTVQTVLTRQGWAEAYISSFGFQPLQEVIFAPVKRGGSNTLHRILVTPNHQWISIDGEIVSCLQVGDRIPHCAARFDEESERYNYGFTHGMTFGDGYFSKVVAAGHRHFVPLFGRGGQHRKRFGHVNDFTCRAKTPTYGGTATIYADRNLKTDMPTETDSDYIAGFLDGWIAADGDSSRPGSWRLRASNIEALAWAKRVAPLAGYAVIGEGIEANMETNLGKRKSPIQWVCLRRDLQAWRVVSITPQPAQEVYCATGCGEFTLQHGILTHNCGAFAQEGELKEMVYWFPEMKWIEELQEEVASTHPWKWGERPPKKDTMPKCKVGIMCQGCGK